MKKLQFLAWATFSLGMLSGCNVNLNDGSGNGQPVVLDSGTTIISHTESHTESNAGFEIKGDAHYSSHTTTHTTTTAGGKEMSLATLLQSWEMAIFSDWKEVEMDPMEAYPQYRSAKTSEFRRLQKKMPVDGDHNRRFYPKILLKAYRFPSNEAMTKEVETWLGELAKADGPIALGEGAKGIKSQPLICAVLDDEFLVVQSSCMYHDEDWTATEQRFLEHMTDDGAAYIFKIGCEGGKLEYLLGGQ